MLYGSETGNARSLADIVVYELKRRNIKNVKTVSIDDYDFNDLLEYDQKQKQINVIFAVSACGQGELPKNCQYFIKDLLAAELRGNLINGKAAKMLDNTLHKMGANRLIEIIINIFYNI